ncbi:MAG: YdbH domain-containing protein, partial [Bdellovibrionales bacterium]|nr:YdbH domain-containing protein [Bdellovibrionales bacterium]
TLGKLSIKEINGPIQLTNSKAEIEIDTDSKNILTLKNISANAFDGTLQVAKLPITDLAKSAFINLKFKNIDIKKLLELMNQEQVEATGSISGEIPINIQNGKISVKNGKLWAIEPGGTIKYLGDDAALGSNPQMMLAMQALKNLKFSTLTANVVYKPDGTLILNTSLAGKGLEMNSSRPINVNLNIEQNILKLFESLHAVDNFTKIKQK